MAVSTIEMTNGQRFHLLGILRTQEIEFTQTSLSGRSHSNMREIHLNNGNLINTYAQVVQDSGTDSKIAVVKLENFAHSKDVVIKIPKDLLLALDAQGRRHDRMQDMLRYSLAEKCKKENLTPVFLSKELKEMQEREDIAIGKDMIVKGVNYGPIVDCTIDGETIVVATSTLLFSNEDCRNSYSKLLFNLYEHEKAIEVARPIPAEEIREFIFMNHELFDFPKEPGESGFPGFRRVSYILENENFMHALGTCLANYAYRNNIHDLLNTTNEDIKRDIATIMEIQMREVGYLQQPVQDLELLAQLHSHVQEAEQNYEDYQHSIGF